MYCSTNSRCILQGLEARKAQCYTWGAYCGTNWTCIAVLVRKVLQVGGAPKQCPPLKTRFCFLVLGFFKGKQGPQSQDIARTVPKNFLNNSRALLNTAMAHQKVHPKFGNVFVTKALCGTSSVPEFWASREIRHCLANLGLSMQTFRHFLLHDLP